MGGERPFNNEKINQAPPTFYKKIQSPFKKEK
jgi:hypothetical protein